MTQNFKTYHIKDVKIPNDTHFYFEESGERGSILRNISKVNIFIGANNSGKSKLLRDILQNKIVFKPASYSTEQFKEISSQFKNEIELFFSKRSLSFRDDMKNEFKKLEIPDFIDETIDLNEALAKIKVIIENYRKSGNTSYGNYSLAKIGNELMPIFEKYNTQLHNECEGSLEKVKFIKIFVPILRGLRPLSGTKDLPTYQDLYQSRTLFDYFPNAYGTGDSSSFRIRTGKDLQNTDEEIIIFTGLGTYDQIRKFLLGNLQERKLISDYEKYLSDNFFDGKPVAIIPSESPNILTLKIGEEKEQPIYNQGDGLQSIVISTFPLFLHKGKNVLFFIDEPEKLLHPGLQRKFIETLLKQEGFESFQFFITTHSNHFLDITLDFPDISIFSFKKIFDKDKGEEKLPKFFVENLSYGDRSALELLGVRNSSIFFSNCTIWVEGITDRLYYRHYLELYQKEMAEQDKDYKYLREDFHFSFVEFGGANITHFSFLSKEKMPINVERLCGKSIVIADRDIGSKETRKELQEKLGGRCHLLKSAEVENLLTKSVLISVLKEYEGEEPDIETFVENDYKKVYLGRFIEDKLKHRKRNGQYQQESGTITDKMGFCRKALSYITKWDDLSSEAKEVTKKIYNHIKMHNS